MWAYIDVLPVTPNGRGMVTWTKTGPGGIGFNYYTDQDGPPKKATLLFINNSWTNNPGQWWSDAGELIEDTLYHLAVTIADVDVIASNPILYKEGLALTTTEQDTPAGVMDSMVGAALMFGNLAGFEFPHDGTIQDVRIYNDVLTPAEIATLHSDGPNGAGITRAMVFHGPCVKTADLAYFTDHAMVAEDVLFDNMYGAVGKETGAVTTRLPD